MQECGPGLITRDAFEEIKDEVKKKHQYSSTSERVTQHRAEEMRPRIDLTLH